VAPFALLFLLFGVLVLLGRLGVRPGWARSNRARMRVALAAMFLFTGLARFITPELLRMIPEFLPFRREALYVSGFFEAFGAIGLLIPRLRRLAGIGLAALLVAVFPANINVAVNNLQIEGQIGHPVYQWARVLWQLVLIWLPLWATQREEPEVAATATRVQATGAAPS
jgi:uncharacterized membrane protein